MKTLLKELQRVQNELKRQKLSIINKENYDFHDVMEYSRLSKILNRTYEMRITLESEIERNE